MWLDAIHANGSRSPWGAFFAPGGLKGPELRGKHHWTLRGVQARIGRFASTRALKCRAVECLAWEICKPTNPSHPNHNLRLNIEVVSARTPGQGEPLK